MFSNFKSKIGHSKLNKRLKTVTRKKMVYNLVSARKIGLIIYLTNENDFNRALDFASFLTKLNLSVDILGYFPGKEIPQSYLLRKSINVFCKKDLNWYYKPMQPFIDEFAAKEFDILIDLSMEEIFPLKWAATLSRAKFKVGNLSYYGNPNDLIINIKPSDNLDYLISQIKHYLNLINNRFAQEAISLAENLN